jgi:hypothetical protein
MEGHPDDRPDPRTRERCGEEVEKRAMDGRYVGLDPDDQAIASAAFFNSSAWSVRSHVKSRSLRPKCPYAAVLR